MKRSEVIAAARGWLATPFRPQQSRKGEGCDCAGLIIGLAKELHLVDETFTAPPYRQQPDGTMQRLCDQHLIRLSRGAERPGDVVMMRFAKVPQHLGVVVPYRSDGLAVIHALMTVGKVCEHRLDARWRKFIIAAYAFHGVED